MKSDFLDALTNAEKQVRDYQSKLEELNENFSKAGRFSLKRIYNMPITFVLRLCNSYINEEKKWSLGVSWKEITNFMRSLSIVFENYGKKYIHSLGLVTWYGHTLITAQVSFFFFSFISQLKSLLFFFFSSLAVFLYGMLYRCFIGIALGSFCLFLSWFWGCCVVLGEREGGCC